MLELNKMTWIIVLSIVSISWCYGQKNYVAIYREYLDASTDLKELIKSNKSTIQTDDSTMLSDFLSTNSISIPLIFKAENKIMVLGNENYLEITLEQVSVQAPVGINVSKSEEGKMIVDLKNRLIFDEKTKKIKRFKPRVLEKKLKSKEKCKSLKMIESGEESETVFCPEVPAFIFPHSFLYFSKNKYGVSSYQSEGIKIELLNIKESDKIIDYKDFFEPYLKMEIPEE